MYSTFVKSGYYVILKGNSNRLREFHEIFLHDPSGKGQYNAIECGTHVLGLLDFYGHNVPSASLDYGDAIEHAQGSAWKSQPKTDTRN